MDARRYKELGVSSAKTALNGIAIAGGTFCPMVPDGDSGFCTVLHSDGTGTKALLANPNDYASVLKLAQDAIVMNTDDMACVGVTGGFIVNTIINRNPDVVDDDGVRNIIAAINDVCGSLRRMGIEITTCGGETADVGEMVTTFTLDVTAVARIRATDVVNNADVRPGDVIVGLASVGQANYEEEPNSGVGSNGLTWLRHDLLPNHPEAVDLLTSPTRTYLPVIKDVIAALRHDVHGMEHITGGGQTKTMRAIPPFHVVKDNMMPVPQVFAMLAEMPDVCIPDMYRVFNMGHRFEIFTAPEHAGTVIDIAASHGVEARVVGRVTDIPGRHLTLHTPYGIYDYE